MIRPAVPADASGIADAHITGWQVAYRGIFPDELLDGMDRERRARVWEERITEGHHVLVAETGGQVVGFSDYGPARHADDLWGELYAIYVHPDHWGQGHGHDLLHATESGLTYLGFGKAHLWVLETNRRARDFYERQGWVASEETMEDTIGETVITEVRYNRDPIREG